MDFQTSHTFTVTPVEYMAIYLDPVFDQFLVDNSSLKERRIIEESRDGDIVRRKLIICSGLDLPTILKKSVGMHELRYTEMVEIDLAHGRWRWTIIPDQLRDKIHASGTTTLRVVPPGGCERTMIGTIRVDIPFIGKIAESYIVEAVKKTYHETARLLETYCAHHRRSS